MSYTRISKYLRCPFSHYLTYVEKLVPKSPSRSLQFGKDFHTLLEHRGDTKEQLKQVFKELKITYDNYPEWFQEVLGETYVKDLKTIFNDYRKRYKDADVPNSTEFEFNIDLGESELGEKIIFNGFIDGLYFDESNTPNEYTVIEEHKTFYQKPDPVTLLFSTQKHLYAKAVELTFGAMPAGILWDYIKNVPAAEPFILKSGKFSEAKNANVTPYSWRRACKKAGFDDKEYINRGKELYDKNISNYFFREYQPFNKDMVDKTFEDFKSVAIDVVNNGDGKKVKNCTKDCSWCEYKPICRAEFNGDDIMAVVDREFTERGKR